MSPPTLISFAVTTEKIENIVTNEFKSPGHKVVLLKAEYDENGSPEGGVADHKLSSGNSADERRKSPLMLYSFPWGASPKPC